jgi:hypothetical protein
MAQKVNTAMPTIMKSEPFKKAVREITNETIRDDQQTQNAIRSVVHDEKYCDYMNGKLARYKSIQIIEVRAFMEKLHGGKNRGRDVEEDAQENKNKMRKTEPNSGVRTGNRNVDSDSDTGNEKD